MTGAQHPAVQRLQFFLSESRWDAGRVNDRRLELLRDDPETAPHGGGVLVIDDSGDRKDGSKTAHVGRQWLGRYGKTDNGVVTVTTLWSDERVYYPVHAVPYTPARHFAKGKNDPGFRTKLAIGADLAIQAEAAGFVFRAVVADSAYGDQDGFRGELAEAGLPFVMALKPRRGTWARGPDAHTPVDAARELAWNGPDDPGDWQAVTRTFRDGHTETWWAADASLGWWGPDGARRLVVATADPAALPAKATWYLVTNLPRPGGPREAGSPHPAAGLAEIVRIYGIRNWIEVQRVAPGTEPQMPKWMAGIDAFTPAKSLGLGLLLAGVDPNNLIMAAGAGSALAVTGPSAGEAVVALIVFVVLGSLTIAGPVVFYLTGGDRAKTQLDAAKEWLSAHNDAVMMVLFLVLGVNLIAKSIPPLT